MCGSAFGTSPSNLLGFERINEYFEGKKNVKKPNLAGKHLESVFHQSRERDNIQKVH